MNADLKCLRGTRGRETEIEEYGKLTRDDIGCAGAGADIGNLPRGGREMRVTLIPAYLSELSKGRHRQMDGVFRQVRVCDMSLYAFDVQRSRE